MKIHCALPTIVFPKRIRAETAVLRLLLGINLACTGVTQGQAACVTAVTNSVQLQGLLLHTDPPQGHCFIKG